MNRLFLHPLRLLSTILLSMLFLTPSWGYTGKVVKGKRVDPAAQAATRSLSAAPFLGQQSRASLSAASPSAHRNTSLNTRLSVVPLTLGAAKSAATSSPQQSEWELWLDEDRNTPIFLQAKSKKGVAKRAAGVRSDAIVLDFVEANAELFRLRQPRRELVVEQVKTDAQGREHVHFAQRYRGIPIWGAALVGHISGDQGLFAVNGRYHPTPVRVESIVPVLTERQAVEFVVSEYGNKLQTFSADMRQLLGYEGPQSELYIWINPKSATPHLVWKVELRPNIHERWRYFIDAKNGEVLDQYQSSPTDGPVVGSGVNLAGETVELNTLQIGEEFVLFDASNALPGFALGTLVGNDRGHRTMQPGTEAGTVSYFVNNNNSFDDAAAVSAHLNMATVYDYFLNTHGRDGINGAGGNMISVVHVPDADGLPMDNAYWNGVFMAYGDGAEAFEPLSGGLDVAAHEMTHGIIQHTADLEYKSQSGALNESIADIFAAMVDSDDWLLGEDIVVAEFFPSGALRSLEDPHNGATRGVRGWQPSHMNEYVELPEDEDNDNGGVHVNSGIPNRAAFLIAQEIGRPRTAQIYYHLLSNYLTPTSQFIDCRLAAEQSAMDLFPDDSQVLAAVSNAFDAVGIVAPTDNGGGGETPTPTEDRSFWVATVGAGQDGDNSLWIVKPASNPEESSYKSQLTTTQVYAETGNAITAPQHGRFVIFIDSDNNLRFIGTDGTGEEVINADGDWGSIAVSPDGGKLAATTTFEDSTIFVFDLDNGTNKPIKLYHPTTAEGITLEATRYADALQWDASGSAILFDSFNSLPGVDGGTIDFWDMKLLVPSSEVIYNWSSVLPLGVHYGNPSFSSELINGQINDCRVLFEKVDENIPQTTIIAWDRCSGEAGALAAFGEDIFTFPRFINNDSEVVLEYWQENEGLFAANLWRLPLSADRLSSAGDLTLFTTGLQSPNAFTIADDTGLVPTAVEEESAAQPTVFALDQNHPNPFNPETVIAYKLAEPAEVVLEVFDISGQLVNRLFSGFRQAGAYEVRWRGTNANDQPVASGVYFYQLSYAGGFGTKTALARKMLLLR
jgi:bacillolysin